MAPPARRARRAEVTPIGRVVLDRLLCRRCAQPGAAVVAVSRDAGAMLTAWCSPTCAQHDGWPWLRSEKTKGKYHAAHAKAARSHVAAARTSTQSQVGEA